jgi:plastocyanin
MCLRMQRLVLLTAASGACVCGAVGCQTGGLASDPAFLRGDAFTAANPVPSAVNPAPSTAPAEVASRQVMIDNFTFAPAQLDVPAGTKVVWVNHDDVPHTVVSNAKLFASKALDTDDQFSHVFAAAGTYPYFCGVHPHMTGQIVVK